MKYRKKPVVIEAVQWFNHGDHPEVLRDPAPHVRRDHGWIATLEGGHVVTPGDWIIKGVAGEFYPCNPDIFAITYDPEPAAGEPKENFEVVDASQVPDELCKWVGEISGEAWKKIRLHFFVEGAPDNRPGVRMTRQVDLEAVARRLGEKCEECGGAGYVARIHNAITSEDTETCIECNGSGHPLVPGVETK